MGSGAGSFLKVVLKNFDVLAGWVSLSPALHYIFFTLPVFVLRID